MKNFKLKKLSIFIIVITLIFTTLFSMHVIADEPCPYHPNHDEKCGYVEAIEAQECQHVHDETCYDENGELNCQHVHDNECGYVEAVEGHECLHRCSYCDDSIVGKGEITVDVKDNKYTVHIVSRLVGEKGEDDVYFYIKIEKDLLQYLNLVYSDNSYSLTCEDNSTLVLTPTYFDDDSDHVYLKYEQGFNTKKTFDLIFISDEELDTDIQLNTASSFKEEDQRKIINETIESNVSTQDVVPASQNLASSEMSLYSAGVPTSQSDETETPTGIDFGQYISNITIFKYNNGVWDRIQTGGIVTDGDGLRVQIDFDLPDDVITHEQKVMYYQLPSGIVPNQELTGIVYEQHIAIGTYLIQKNGLITITFYDEFANGTDFNGHIEFQGMADLGENNTTDQTVTIDQMKFTITPSTESIKYDISIDKQGTYENNQLKYELNISSTNGTSETVSIEDTISGGIINQDSFVITDKNGNSVSGYTKEILTDGKTFKISGLPQMDAGDSYKISYTATPPDPNSDGSSEVTNNASATSGSKIDWSYNKITISEAVISKTGSPDATSGKINWTIEVKNVKADTITDILPDGLEWEKNSDGDYIATLISETGQEEIIKINYDSANNRFSYTFTEGHSGNYTIKYSTKVIDPGEPGDPAKSYKNTATLNEFSNDSIVSYRPLSAIIKTFKGVDTEKETSSGGIYNWEVELNLPKNKTNYTYSDELTSDYSQIVHYIEKNSFNLKIVDESGKSVTETGYSITYNGSNGNTYTSLDNVPSDVYIIGFQIQFENSAIANASKLVIKYGSYAVYAMEPGDAITYINTGKVGNNSSTTSETKRKPKKLEKYIGTWDGSARWKQIHIPDSNGTGQVVEKYKANYYTNVGTLEYDEINGRLYYMLLLSPNGEVPTEDVIVTDQLPEGTSLNQTEEFKPFAGYRNNGGEIYDYSETINNYSYYLNTSNHFHYNIDSNTNILTFTVDKQIFQLIKDKNLNQLAICYVLDIDKDLSGKDITKVYTNSVQWGDNTDTLQQKVHIDAKYLDKKGIEDDNGNLNYSLIINPTGLDLLEGSDYLTLTDTLSLDISKVSLVSFINDSLKVYTYDSNNGKEGELIDPSLYSYTYDVKTLTLTMKIPDGKPLVVKYQYAIDGGNNAQVTVTNNATLEGISQGNSENEYEWKTASSSASVYRNVLQIYKVNSQNYQIGLSGAQFSLEESGDNNDWTNPIEIINNLETDGGLAEINLHDKSLSVNKLYRLKEKVTPTGYEYQNQYTYFVLCADGATLSDTISVINGQLPTGVALSDVTFLNDSGGTLYIPNDYTSLVVRKNWIYEDGTTYDGEKPEVNLTLKRSTFTRTRINDEFYTVNIYLAKGLGQNDIDNAGTEFELINTYNVKIGENLKIIYNYSGTTINDHIMLKVDGVKKEFEINDPNHFYIFSSSLKDSTHDIYIWNYNWYDSPTTRFSENHIEPGYSEVIIPNEDTETIAKITLTGNKDTNKIEYYDSYSDFQRDNDQFDDGWTYTWTDLPDNNGKAGDEKEEYIYFIEETPISGWSSSIDGNNVTTGTIQVINTKEETSNVLPETGGSGITIFILSGITMICLSLMYFIRKRHTYRKVGDS